MGIVKAGPNEYLLIGRGGTLQNRGSAVQTFVRPGTISVLVPSTKQEAAFEFTQETRDGIPLRFKGIILYRITDPVAAARQFDFANDGGVEAITALLTHVCLGELRHAVSHMTMVECIEQRKSTLSGVAAVALAAATQRPEDGAGDSGSGWGITVEVAQLAQVFIVDQELRRQLESEIRNEIKLKSEQSDLRTLEETKVGQLESAGRIAEQKLESDREDIRREEALELVRIERRRRAESEQLATERQALELEQARFHAQSEVERDRVDTETPVRLHRLAADLEILRQEIETRQLRTQAKALDVEEEMLLPRSQQALRREILPLEQAPQIVEAASRVLSGTSLSVYGDDSQVIGQLAPIFDLLARAVSRTTTAGFAGREEA